MRLVVSFLLPATILAAVEPFKVPVFQISDLKNGLQDAKLSDALRTTGLISIQHEDIENTALDAICNCWSQSVDHNAPFLASIDGTDAMVLPDGQTVRSTLATATVGRNPLPLPSSLDQVCGEHVRENLESLRDDLAAVNQVFIKALDRLLYGTSTSTSEEPTHLLKNNYGGIYPTMESIVKASNNLEHFHLYSKASDDGSKKQTRDLHTDAGLFLSFLPAYSCHSDAPDDSFYIQDMEGVTRPAEFAPNTVGVMLGIGAEEWLHTAVPLKAARHEVRMNAGDRRAWYGMSKY